MGEFSNDFTYIGNRRTKRKINHNEIYQVKKVKGFLNPIKIFLKQFIIEAHANL